MHPVFDRPLVILLNGMTGVKGCFLGLPLGRFGFTGVTSVLSDCDAADTGAGLMFSMDKSSSPGSSFGIVKISSDPCSQFTSFSASSRSAKPILHVSVQEDEAEWTMVGAEELSKGASTAELMGDMRLVCACCAASASTQSPGFGDDSEGGLTSRGASCEAMLWLSDKSIS